MTLTQTLIFAGLALLGGWLARARSEYRLDFILVISVLAVFWLQPALPIRYLDFWLPLVTLLIIFLCWVLLASPEQRALPANRLTVLLVLGLVSLIALTRFLPFDFLLSASRPPQFWQVLVLLGLTALAAFALIRWWRPSLLIFAIILLIGLILIQKTPFLSEILSGLLRAANGQSVEQVSALDLRWLGFSYIVFRLIHTLRDRQEARLPDVSLKEYFAYVIFFPALTAGPIDRIERFVGGLREPVMPDSEGFVHAGERFFVGLFKKYVVADGLALITLNSVNATQVQHSFWAWVILYAYAFQIYFDFSGYTDIVIGIARLLGINLPENFNAPYLKPNLTQFWNNWHMSLTQWFRFYYFNPVNRWLRRARRPLSIPLQILFMQVSTMVLIGLWHGVTWNFVLWGLWHGLGLFIHNRWSDYIKPKAAALLTSPARQQLFNLTGIFLTFNFVALGWVFFALPTPLVSERFFLVLFGLNR